MKLNGGESIGEHGGWQRCVREGNILAGKRTGNAVVAPLPERVAVLHR